MNVDEQHEESQRMWLLALCPELGEEAVYVDAAWFDADGVYFVDFKGSEHHGRPSCSRWALNGHRRLAERGIRVLIVCNGRQAWAADLEPYWCEIESVDRRASYPWNWENLSIPTPTRAVRGSVCERCGTSWPMALGKQCWECQDRKD